MATKIIGNIKENREEKWIKTDKMAHVQIGNMEPFDPNEDDWESYTERFEIFVACNNIAEAKMVTTLLTVIGKSTYKTLKDLCTPNKPSQLTYKQAKEKLQSYFDPKPHFITERIKFNNRTQQKGESIQEYVKEIKKLSSNCKFGKGLTEHLRDRLVSGLRNNKIKRRFRLMKEDDLTFDNALKEALLDELADKDDEESVAVEELNYFKGNKYRIPNNRKTNKGAQWNTKEQCLNEQTENNDRRGQNQTKMHVLWENKPQLLPVQVQGIHMQHM